MSQAFLEVLCIYYLILTVLWAENRTQGFMFTKHAPEHRLASLASPITLNLDQNPLSWLSISSYRQKAKG